MPSEAIMDLFLLGAIAMASLTLGLFFLRFWKDTGDRLFMFFAMSFLLEGLSRTALAFSYYRNEEQPFFYFVRFLSYVLILIGIVNKNRTKNAPSKHAGFP
jgi:hypothetical protein